MRGLSRWAIVLVSVAAGCAAESGVPPSLQPTKDYPCGPGGLVCPGRMCCDDTDVCGDGTALTGCPAGMCCFIEPGGTEKKRPPKAQRPMPSP